MKSKNIKRAAHALYQSQADDKNELLVSCLSGNPDAVKLVKDQGRALVVLEKLVLPQGKYDFSEEEMERILLRKLTKKGHRIQEDDAEDTPEYAAEKKAALDARTARVPDLFGKSLADLSPKEEDPVLDDASIGNYDPDLEVPTSTYSVLDAQKQLGVLDNGVEMKVLDLRDEHQKKVYLDMLKENGVPVKSKQDPVLSLVGAAGILLAVVELLRR
jgi:hypothetical protein